MQSLSVDKAFMTCTFLVNQSEQKSCKPFVIERETWHLTALISLIQSLEHGSRGSKAVNKKG